MSTPAKSLLNDSRQLGRAVQLIELGARMAVLESETSLSHERLLRLYREVTGQSPSKGQLPYSTDWFTSWQPNIHASLFLNIYENLNKTCDLDQIDLITKAWQLYEADVKALGVEAMLSITRAWRLVKFVDSDMLCLTPCTHCGGHFVTHSHEYGKGFKAFVCGMCEPPARAGKSRRTGAIH
ncbi:flagellar transcriptional regulator FlhC [uncultured Ramlibacter sp.]|uniref:flagellar transcriptional regulator FlhC n=1 Tax=uncultured Ramlibacter sp. TaxID=260755 RepID=UPI002627E962|nr:flagellar transcriptional regulator FlhC [uncultured Ramlibacter sp.]